MSKIDEKRSSRELTPNTFFSLTSTLFILLTAVETGQDQMLLVSASLELWCHFFSGAPSEKHSVCVYPSADAGVSRVETAFCKELSVATGSDVTRAATGKCI